MRSKVEETNVRKNAVLKIIHRHLTPRQKQKKDFGEVFTPIQLVNDMLDKLPKSVWTNPYLTWLDPANGIGNFPITIFYRLDEGLKSWQPNEAKRRKHIIENMLFMMELQPSNNRIARNIFSKLCESCTPNIWTVNTLSTTKAQILEHFGIEHIDIIVGNPPFQAFQKAGEKRGGGDELYMKFVRHSLDILKKDGHLLFVHPPSWRKPEFSEGRKKSKNAGMFELMTHEHQMEYLEIHNAKDGQALFKASTRYDFYHIVNSASTRPTTIKDELGNVTDVHLKQYGFLPNFDIKNVIKLLATDDDEQCELNKCILYERSAYGTDKAWVSDTKTDVFKYPLVHNTAKEGPRFFYSNTKEKGFFDVPKVIFGDSGINEPILDMEGKYGMTQHALAIRVSSQKEGERLVKFLKSNFFKNILQACMWSSFQIDWRLFTYFKNDFWRIEVDLDEPAVESESMNGGMRHRYTRKKRRY
jgi:hypothetical protein